MVTAEQIIELFGMKPLKGEGGFYAETYRCSERIAEAHLPTGYVGDRSLGSAILYLLTPDTFSALHRLKSDEIFHFYLGDPVTMLQLHAGGSSSLVTLGPDILNGQKVQAVIPRGTWFGCILRDGGQWALMGTTMAPGFDFSDYESGRRQELISQFPSQRDTITRLTRKE